MCMWSSFWSPGLFLLICLLRIITDCSFIMFTTECSSSSFIILFRTFLAFLLFTLQGCARS